MKTINLNIITLILLSGCRILNSGTSYIGEERVFGKYFNHTFETHYRKAISGEANWELGIAFQPLGDGKIKGIRIKNPTQGPVRLSFWDADTRMLLQTFSHTISNNSEYNYGQYDIPLKANKTYCITINVGEYYYYALPFEPLPITFNKVKLLGSVYEESPYQRFPQYTVTNVFHGLIDLDIDFKIN